MFQLFKRQKKIVIHILIWICFLTLIILQVYQVNVDFSNRILLGTSLNIIIFYLNYSYLVPKLLLKKRALLYFGSLLAILLLTLVIIRLAIPFSNLPSLVSNKGISPSKSMFPLVFSAVFIITGTAIRMYEEWIINDRNKKEIEAKKNVSELEALKNQLNPHFLFNSLNSIYALTTKKSNDAPEAVITLSELMRYMLYRTNEVYVPLQQELEYIENYIKLQRLRIANNEDVKINIIGTIGSQQISPLLFISFIENAFKYGTDYNGKTQVKIKVSINENKLHFKCVNLIGNKSKNDIDSGIGLANTKERLQLLYPEKHWLEIKEEHNKFIVDLTLKLN